MNPTHFHLVATHLPIYGTFIGVVIMLAGLFLNKKSLKYTALVLFTCMSLVAIPVFLSGEEAEETMEELIPDSRQAIHEHEELAEKAIWLMAILGVFSVASIIAMRKEASSSTLILWLTFLLSLGTFTQYFFVGKLGGEIRHTEIRAANSSSNINAPAAVEHDDEDDDED